MRAKSKQRTVTPARLRSAISEKKLSNNRDAPYPTGTCIGVRYKYVDFQRNRGVLIRGWVLIYNKAARFAGRYGTSHVAGNRTNWLGNSFRNNISENAHQHRIRAEPGGFCFWYTVASTELHCTIAPRHPQAPPHLHTHSLKRRIA